MAFKIFRKNCCGLDVHKTWIFACVGITDSNGRTEYKQVRFSSFTVPIIFSILSVPIEDWMM